MSMDQMTLLEDIDRIVGKLQEQQLMSDSHVKALENRFADILLRLLQMRDVTSRNNVYLSQTAENTARTADNLDRVIEILELIVKLLQGQHDATNEIDAETDSQN